MQMIERIRVRFALWVHWYFRQEFTVACDISPFRHPCNEREQLFHRRGFLRAWWFGKRWVVWHSTGQARILPGHYEWDEKTIRRSEDERMKLLGGA